MCRNISDKIIGDFYFLVTRKYGRINVIIYDSIVGDNLWCCDV